MSSSSAWAFVTLAPNEPMDIITPKLRADTVLRIVFSVTNCVPSLVFVRKAKQYRPNAIEYRASLRAHSIMMHVFKTGLISLVLVMAASSAHAACFADYKAKIDQPLRLHYGVIALSDAACSDPKRAQREAQAKLAQAGWTLLNIVSTFGREGLESRRADAGQYYLRF